MLNSSIVDNICPTKKQWADEILDYIGLDPEIAQVMGSYSLSRVDCDKWNFRPNDCDIFVRVSSLEEFVDYAYKQLGKITRFISEDFFISDGLNIKVNRKYDDALLEVIFKFKAETLFNFQFQFHTFKFQFVYCKNEYSHIQVSNYFDISCCKFRTFHLLDPITGEKKLVTVSNNTRIKELTFDANMIAKSTNNNMTRISKYEERGFKLYGEPIIVQNTSITMVVRYNNCEDNYQEKGNVFGRFFPYSIWNVMFILIKMKIKVIRLRERMYMPGGVGQKRAAERYNELNNKRIKL